jgi:hypothetical protein
MLTTEHPTEETLAAFVDDRLDSATRREATEHFASCGECREIVLMATDFQVSEEPSNVRKGTFGGRGWTAAAGLAAAAAIAVFVVQPFRLDREEVIADYQALPLRSSIVRLQGDLKYREPVKVTRSGDKKPEQEGTARLWGAAERAEKERNPHLLGLTMLLLAQDSVGLTSAVTDLEAAFAKAQGAERDVIANDLAAALVARANWTGEQKDAIRALELVDDVLKRNRSPELLWNRAVALGLIDAERAIAAWDDYLKIDSTSQWAEEAKTQKANLAPFGE